MIPARHGSHRFPGKPLALIAGKPMVRWVYESARRALGRAVVATDDERILRCVRGFGGEAVMTSRRCRSGTDRVWEAARRIPARLYVNVQGDEPLMSARTLRRVVALHRDRRTVMGTAATPLADERAWRNPDVVKVLVDASGRALYFSRAAVPFFRGGRSPLFHSGARRGRVLKHLGVYSYTRAMLRQFVRWPSGFLEEAEKLEQLRALENGAAIRVAETPDDSIGVDRPEDAKKVETILKRRLGVSESESRGVKVSRLLDSKTPRLSDAVESHNL